MFMSITTSCVDQNRPSIRRAAQGGQCVQRAGGMIAHEVPEVTALW
jgi:hypothetical protein